MQIWYKRGCFNEAEIFQQQQFANQHQLPTNNLPINLTTISVQSQFPNKIYLRQKANFIQDPKTQLAYQL